MKNVPGGPFDNSIELGVIAVSAAALAQDVLDCSISCIDDHVRLNGLANNSILIFIG